ncbi:hypothetical protein PHJA_000839700 [Phtheirospermum japonicum]|uniref:Uncharacterized protein n=1 Tax=Phtheirospermum japonicum TaxID=374723 RepID=A0A830BN13_9LAMI|nr:hypothetical protein PHJA_000839700 [Phtheirospermum japonicum]
MSRPDFDFDSLSELHNSVNELLHSPNTKLEIIHGGHKKWAHQVSESSLRMADSCAAAKDLLLLARDHLQNLQSAFRRITATETATAGNTFAPHRLPRKQLKKAILKRLHSLKGMKTTYSAASPPPDHSLAVVVDLLKEVRATTLLIVRSLFSLIAIPNPDGKGKPGPGRKDPVFMRIKLTRVDSLSFWEKCDVSDIREVTTKLEEVEIVVQELEAELQDMFRRLIRTRASLLNILTT